MKKFLQNIFYLFVFVMLCALGVYGVIVAPLEMTKPLGVMQIAAFDTGISVYKQNFLYFYNFSPVNDYMVNRGTRKTFITIDDLKSRRVVSDFQKNKIDEIKTVLLNYFSKWNPEIKFGEGFKAKYETEISGNRAVIRKTITLNQDIEIVGQTVSFQGIDLVFDSRGNLYTFASKNVIDLINKIYGLDLKQVIEGDRVKVEDKTINIMSPEFTGVVKLMLKENQSLWVDITGRLIEIEESVNAKKSSQLSTTLEMEVLDHPK